MVRYDLHFVKKYGQPLNRNECVILDEPLERGLRGEGVRGIHYHLFLSDDGQSVGIDVQEFNTDKAAQKDKLIKVFGFLGYKPRPK